MKKKNLSKRITFVIRLLDEYFPCPESTLQASTTYTFLLAVLLSARCFDVRVNQVTPILFQRADSPEKMVQLDVEEIRQIIRPCGLSLKKARAIWSLSDLLVRYHEGCVPATRSGLEALPGVGRKTASVVLAQCFGIAAFPVDTHVFRCSKRWGLSSSRSREGVERDLMVLIPEHLWMRVHLQMIAAGRQICPSQGHDAIMCPFCCPTS